MLETLWTIIFIFLGFIVFVFIFFGALQIHSDRTYKPTREEIEQILMSIINGNISDAELDEFICVRIKYDPDLEMIRELFVEIDEDGSNIADAKEGFFYNEKGMKKIKELLKNLNT